MVRRLQPLRRVSAMVLLGAWAAGSAGLAQAGLFDDDEARRLATEAKAHAESRLDQQAQAQLDLAGLIQRQNDEIAQLRGRIETLEYELEQAKKRQQDLYLDLDTRLRHFEGTAGSAAPANRASTSAADSTLPASADPAREAEAYEAALNQFKAGKYKTASGSFGNFVKKYPNSSLAANAQYWLGNSLYAQGQCKKAIEAQTVVTKRYAKSDKAPDAWLAIATCQQELGSSSGAKKALNTILTQYPDSPAADKAEQRLQSLP